MSSVGHSEWEKARRHPSGRALPSRVLLPSTVSSPCPSIHPDGRVGLRRSYFRTPRTNPAAVLSGRGERVGHESKSRAVLGLRAH